MFSNLSNIAEGVDNAFLIILSIIFFFLIGLTVLLVVFIFRYRESKNPKATQIEGNNTLELLWTIIPLILVLGMFYFGWTSWKPLNSDPPKDAMVIKVTARMWNWSFEYENGKHTDTLYIPAGKPVALDMKALDVIHSLYIPAFRIKQDIIPGTPRKAWFIANSPGSYDLFCAEYCGLQHSYMLTSVEVKTSKEFDAWYIDTTQTVVVAASPQLAGKQIVQKYGCNACHSTDGTKIVGPSYKGIFGEEITVITGGKERIITVDEEYIRHSILEPDADVVKGYNKGLMITYRDQITEEEINLIIEYIKSLK
ncbi:MAG: cytochrome c oxidase subunit II [Bacteroidales bacterium]|nr:cytochrome c oxidase subunit II [Bacteroidales bacterium]